MSNDDQMEIPCLVTDPRTSVSLVHKETDQVLSNVYDSKRGFVGLFSSGTYACRALINGQEHDSIEYIVHGWAGENEWMYRMCSIPIEHTCLLKGVLFMHFPHMPSYIAWPICTDFVFEILIARVRNECWRLIMFSQWALSWGLSWRQKRKLFWWVKPLLSIVWRKAVRCWRTTGSTLENWWVTQVKNNFLFVQWIIRIYSGGDICLHICIRTVFFIYTYKYFKVWLTWTFNIFNEKIDPLI